MDRSTWDRIVSGAGAVLAIALIMIGAAAVYGGNFGRDSVQDGSGRRKSRSLRWTR